jgi:hypothetical protein
MAKNGFSEPPMTATPDVAPALPLFYRRPVALSPERHFGLALVPPGNYEFARYTNAVPLNVSEFSLAARHYPIVFTAGDPAAPVAVVGVGVDHRNVFIDAAGKWLPGVYVPAYVRRYPFIFSEDRAKKEFVLSIDEAANGLQERAGPEDKLFWEGKPTALVERALAFCSEYQTSVEFTRQFCAAMTEQGLFSEKEASFALTDGRKFRLTGFRVIDEARFDKIPGKSLLRLRRQRFLHPIYLHLVSMANWAMLLDLAAQQGK